jgi:hypothetical protein
MLFGNGQPGIIHALRLAIREGAQDVLAPGEDQGGYRQKSSHHGSILP